MQSHCYILKLVPVDGDQPEDAAAIQQIIQEAYQRFNLRCWTSLVTIVQRGPVTPEEELYVTR